MSNIGFLRASFILGGGLSVWAAHFTILYAFNALACARGAARAQVGEPNLVAVVATGATMAAAVALTFVIVVAIRTPVAAAHRNDPARFLRFISIAGAGLAGVAIIFNLLAALLIPPCA